MPVERVVEIPVETTLYKVNPLPHALLRPLPLVAVVFVAKTFFVNPCALFC